MRMIIMVVVVVVVCSSRCFDHLRSVNRRLIKHTRVLLHLQLPRHSLWWKHLLQDSLRCRWGMVCWPSHLQSFANIHPPPLQGPKSAPKIEAARASRASFFWTALGVASWAACSALGQAGNDVWWYCDMHAPFCSELLILKNALFLSKSARLESWRPAPHCTFVKRHVKILGWLSWLLWKLCCPTSMGPRLPTCAPCHPPFFDQKLQRTSLALGAAVAIAEAVGF